MIGYVFHDTNGPKHWETSQIPWYLLNEICTQINLPDCCGRDTSKKLIRTWMGENSELGMYVCSSENKGYFCQYMWMTSKWLERAEYGSYEEENDEKCRH